MANQVPSPNSNAAELCEPRIPIVLPDHPDPEVLTVVWKVFQHGDPKGTIVGMHLPVGSGAGTFRDMLSFSADAPGSYTFTTEVWGGRRLMSSMTPTITLHGPSSARPDQMIRIHALLTITPKEIWSPDKVHAGYAEGLPVSAYCTPDIPWISLLGKSDAPPSLEVLRNLAAVAAQLQLYHDTLFDGASITILEGWTPAASGKITSSALAHAEGKAIDFKVRATRADDVQRLLDPYHPGGLEFARGYTHIDMRGYFARLNRSGRFERLYPLSCAMLPALTDEEIIAAFGRTFTTRKLPAGALPPNCTCTRRAGDPARDEPKECFPIASCRCLPALPAATDAAVRLAEASATVSILEETTRRITATISTELFTTLPLIKPDVGRGAYNLKEYAFCGAFLGKSGLSGVTPVRMRRDCGFAEEWIVKIPVTVALTGDFHFDERISYDFGGEIDNFLILSPGHQQVMRIDGIELSAYPESIGSSSGEKLSNTAGDGEAYGDHLRVESTFTGVEVENNLPGDGSSVDDWTRRIRYSFAQKAWVNETPAGSGTNAVCFPLTIVQDYRLSNEPLMVPNETGELVPARFANTAYTPPEPTDDDAVESPWTPSYLGKTFTVDSADARLRNDDVSERTYTASDTLPAGAVVGDPVRIPRGAVITVSRTKVHNGNVYVYADGFGWTRCTNLAGGFANETLALHRAEYESDEPTHKTVGVTKADLFRLSKVDYRARANNEVVAKGEKVRITQVSEEGDVVEIARADGEILGWTKGANLSGKGERSAGDVVRVTDANALLRDRVELATATYLPFGGRIDQGTCVTIVEESADTASPGEFVRVVSMKKVGDEWQEDADLGWARRSNLARGWNSNITGTNSVWEKVDDEPTYAGLIDLVDIVDNEGGCERLATATLEAYRGLVSAAASAGFTLKMRDGFRDYNDQARLFDHYGSGRAARPGTSNHQNGKAQDLDTDGFDGALYKWLTEHATEHGYIRTVADEDWHWELRPEEAAALRKQGTFKRNGVEP